MNDTYGHNIGDEVLKVIANTVNKNIRSNDILGRWGGEEFIAIIRVDAINELKRIAEKLRGKVMEAYHLLEGNTKVSVTISIGGTLYINNESIESLISRADANMYNAKQTGRNKVTIV